jgi:hypothetical protein
MRVSSATLGSHTKKDRTAYGIKPEKKSNQNNTEGKNRPETKKLQLTTFFDSVEDKSFN